MVDEKRAKLPQRDFENWKDVDESTFHILLN